MVDTCSALRGLRRTGYLPCVPCFSLPCGAESPVLESRGGSGIHSVSVQYVSAKSESSRRPLRRSLMLILGGRGLALPMVCGRLARHQALVFAVETSA